MEVGESQPEVEIQENKKIDMSLDDIIKLQKEESDVQSTSNQTGQHGRLKRGNFQNKRYFRNPPRNQQGPGRPKPGFRQQRFPGMIRNNTLGPITRRRAAASLNGVSPLNRPNLPTTNSQKVVKTQTQNVQLNPRKYRAANITSQTLTRRFNTQTRRPQIRDGQKQQRTNTVNQNKRLMQQVTMNRGKRQTTPRRWQNNDSFGSTLTVSVPNPKAGLAPQSKKPALKRPGGRFRKTEAQSTDPPPKGVPLRFNFRATANHTNVTLNERFSTLKIRGQYTPARRGARMVMIN
ncbi:UAP56-interacting factor-like isoform X2 [Hyla sarda]|uniref:UAP56-interacting factor-like isoform X2 n=1 Tax=Hyla sarda TaxID=327740 RepID=UPI0024C45E51|nr:UAP56-interacting factor-like isoform X2 [Hyla sarda]